VTTKKVMTTTRITTTCVVVGFSQVQVKMQSVVKMTKTKKTWKISRKKMKKMRMKATSKQKVKKTSLMMEVWEVGSMTMKTMEAKGQLKEKLALIYLGGMAVDRLSNRLSSLAPICRLRKEIAMMRDSLRLEDSICNQGEDRCRKRARLATRSRRIIRGGGEEINNKINNIAMLVGAAISRTPDKVVATLVVDNKER